MVSALDPPDRRAADLVAIDANVLDHDGTDRGALVQGLLAMVADGRLRLFVPSGVASELRHPKAPAWAGAATRLAVRPPVPSPTARRQIDRIRVRAILRGDGRPGKHDADASHLSEAAEAGCDHFLTQDRKILRKRDVLGETLVNLSIATLAEFMRTRI